MNTLEQDNYLNLIYKCKDSKQAVLDFYAFKDSILPNKIYRYQKCSNKNIDALKNNYIWLSNPDEFNTFLLRNQKMMPLSSVGISSVQHEEYYIVFGALSLKSSLKDILLEITSLVDNALDLAEITEEYSH